MAKINRYNGNLKPFGSEALGTERTVFGDIAQSDALDANITADFLRGWGIVGVNENPTKQDFNGLAFTLGQLISYLHQRGVPEWNTFQEYYEGSVVTTLDGIYRLKAGGNATIDPDTDAGVNWEKAPTRADIEDLVIRVTSIADMEAYSAPVGYVFSLNAGGRSGTFNVVAGNFSVELAADTYNGIYVGLDDDPTATTKVAKRVFNHGNFSSEWFGALSNVTSGNLVRIQSAVDILSSMGGGVLLNPPGDVWVDYDITSGDTGLGIQLKNNVFIDNRATVLRGIPTDQTGYEVVAARSLVTTVCGIFGGSIYGERDSHIGVTGEFGMGVSIRGCSNFILKDIKIFDCWGDGIYVGNDRNVAPVVSSGKVILDNVFCDNNRRQGLSIIGVEYLYMSHGEFINTNGTGPAAGIDIEPNPGAEFPGIGTVEIKSAVCSGNQGNGLFVFATSERKVEKVILGTISCINNGENGFEFSSLTELIADNLISTDNALGAVGVFNCGDTFIKSIISTNNNSYRQFQNASIFFSVINGKSCHVGTISSINDTAPINSGSTGAILEIKNDPASATTNYQIETVSIRESNVSGTFNVNVIGAGYCEIGKLTVNGSNKAAIISAITVGSYKLNGAFLTEIGSDLSNYNSIQNNTNRASIKNVFLGSSTSKPFVAIRNTGNKSIITGNNILNADLSVSAGSEAISDTSTGSVVANNIIF